MLDRMIFRWFVGLCMSIAIAISAQAQKQATCTYKLLRLSSPYTGGQGYGINKYGNIVGNADDSQANQWALIYYTNETFKTYMAPGANGDRPRTWFNHRNDSGFTVGGFVDGNGISHGLVYYNSSATTVDYPGSFGTQLTGVNKYGTIVGFYVDGSGNSHGFRLSNKQFSSIEYPNSSSTTPASINDSGVVVGSYYSKSGVTSAGFILENGVYHSLSDPYAANGTVLNDVNDYGTIVGVYYKSNLSPQGFLYKNSTFEDVNVPGALKTEASGISVYGTITGGADFGQGMQVFTANCK